MQSSSQIITTNKPVFLQAGCHSCHPTNSVRALKWKISHSMELLTPSSPGVFQLCLWPLIAPDYLGGGLPCLSSALCCQYPTVHHRSPHKNLQWLLINIYTGQFLLVSPKHYGQSNEASTNIQKVIMIRYCINNTNNNSNTTTLHFNSHFSRWICVSQY